MPSLFAVHFNTNHAFRSLLTHLAGSFVLLCGFIVIAIVVFGFGFSPAHAAKFSAALGGKPNDDPVKASLHADLSIDPGSQRLWMALRLQHAPGWHTYWVNPGDSGLATSFEWTLPAGWTAPKPYWPMPERIPVGPLMNFGYEGDLWLPLAVELPAHVREGVYPIRAQLRWLMCSDVCIPGEAAVGLELRLPGPKQSSIREALNRVPQNTLAMSYRREGDKIWLRPDPGTDAAKLLVRGDRQAAQVVSYFPEQSGWMVNPAKQTIQDDKESGWALLLTADKSFQDKPVIDGYLRLDNQTYRVIAQGGPSQGGPTQGILTQGVAAHASAKQTEVLLSQQSRADQGLMLLLVMALLGGLLLNAMPCVFPVIGIKLLSLVPASQSAKQPQPQLQPQLQPQPQPTLSASEAYPRSSLAVPTLDAASIEHGVRKASLLYGLGVLLSFWVLGLIVLLLQAGGEQVGWGFQLQEPGFVLAMFLLFLLIGANLLGLFEVGSSFMSWAGKAEFGALGSGVLAVLVATPCTAPMMGAALGASLSQGPVEAMAVFTALALGMALPYGALALRPQWIHRLPRPGPWMVWIRKAMAFPMFLAAVWLAWVFVLQTDQDSVLRLGFSTVCLLAACWLYGERVQSGWIRSAPRPWSAMLCVALLLLSLLMPLSGGESAKPAGLDINPASRVERSDKLWAPWSPEAVEQALRANEIVFIDFTAAWCVSCQVNKQMVLSTESVSELFAAQKVRSFRGDWTKQDPRITATLSEYGRRGVPLYLVLRHGRAPQVLPEVLTYGLVRDAVLAAAAP